MRNRNHRRLIIALILILVIGGVVAAALLTLEITSDQPATGAAIYPYTATYQVSLPDGERIRIGSLDILAIQTGDRITLKIGSHREEMQQGEIREIGSHVFSIRVFGVPVFETGYQVSATWTGIQEDQDLFRIVLQTNRQVPEWLMNLVIHGPIKATPA
jgi:hypothetical protein